MADPRRTVSVALFVTLGLVAAFMASAVAGFWGDASAPTGLPVFAPALDDPAEVRVEVLNGAGRSGMARDATHRLRGDGFDVVFFGNADHFGYDRSMVVDRTGHPARARAVAAALGIDSVATAVDSALMLEVTVVLGDDWPPPLPSDRSWINRLRSIVGQGNGPDTAGG